MDTITLKNCHLKDSAIISTGGARVGGLIGWTAGYDVQDDGPVDTYVTIEDCSVTGCTITASGSVGGIIGHAGGSPATYHTIKNCTVTDNKLTSNDESYRVGVVVGTANVGEVNISGTTSSGNTLVQKNDDAEIARPEGQSDLYGRFVPGGTGILTIDGVNIIPSGTDANAAFENAVTANVENIVVDLADDVTYDVGPWDTDAMGGEDTKTITINGNGHTITFDNTDSDWNHITAADGVKLIISNATIDNSGHNDGPWNRHDICFACEVELNNVTSNKAIALEDGATLNGVTINDTTAGVYQLWIQSNGQTVTLDGCTITGDGSDDRGIAIKDEYVDSPKRVTLIVTDTTITSQSKAAILVTSTAGANITLSNVDISDVAADSTNAVWVDEDRNGSFELVTVTGGTKWQEGNQA